MAESNLNPEICLKSAKQEDILEGMGKDHIHHREFYTLSGNMEVRQMPMPGSSHWIETFHITIWCQYENHKSLGLLHVITKLWEERSNKALQRGSRKEVSQHEQQSTGLVVGSATSIGLDCSQVTFYADRASGSTHLEQHLYRYSVGS